MLYELYVENFAIIGKMRLGFLPGLNVLSGETGAGKSLVVDAVALLIGGRGNDTFIRGGYERCLIEGVFTSPFTEDVRQKLTEGGINPDDGEQLILTRELIRGGKSVCRINGRAVNLGQLRELGRLLLNIHGQMEHMLLLEEDKQLQLLDSYGGSALLAHKRQVAEVFAVLRERRQFLDDYERHQEQRQERIALLGGQIEELAAAALSPVEEETLRAEAQRLNHGEKLLALANEAQGYLSGGSGALDILSAAVEALRRAAQLDELAQALCERLESLYFEAEDAGRDIARYSDSLGTDSYRLDEIESRLGLLSRLRKKYGGESRELLEYLQKAQAELESLEELDFSGAKARRALAEAEAAYAAAAKDLSAARQQAAQALSAAITEELQMLCMAEADFRVDLPPHPPSTVGDERALFMIRTNTGEQIQPVAKIASGGELSRVVLAMKVILSKLDAVPTLIFDEVDSGLGGRALNAVAQRLAYVGKSTQTIAVTHAPVMAAAAGRQLHVGKHVVEGRTEITVKALEGEERVDELARMIAGEHISDITRRQAMELLEKN